MYKTLILIFISFICFNCKAQTILNNSDTDYFILPNNCYLKDNNNYFNTYIGEWKYSSNNTSLTIKVRKIYNYFNGRYYEDLLIGEYKYIENGIEKINTLPFFLTNFSNQYQHHITGYIITEKNKKNPQCLDCENIPMIKMTYSDPIKNTTGSIVMGIYDIENIKIFITSDPYKYNLDSDGIIESEYVGITIPTGWYVLGKQD